jgi:hypothetical protein
VSFEKLPLSWRNSDYLAALRPKLERRLTRLENALNIAEEDRHDSDGVQLEETKTSIQGTRVRPQTASLSLDAHGRVIGDALASTQKTLEHTLGYSPTQVPPDQVSNVEIYVYLFSHVFKNRTRLRTQVNLCGLDGTAST